MSSGSLLALIASLALVALLGPAGVGGVHAQGAAGPPATETVSGVAAVGVDGTAGPNEIVPDTATVPDTVTVRGTATLPDTGTGGSERALTAVDGLQAQVGGDDPFASNSTIAIQLEADGDARVRVTTWLNLTDEAERQEFRSLGQDFERGRTSADLGLNAFRNASAAASTATGRPMDVTEAERSWWLRGGETGNATGHLQLSFTWTNFAAVRDDGSQLVVDGATTRPWLGELWPGQTLVIHPPEGFTPVTGGTIRNESFYWEGPRTFTPETVPTAVFRGDPEAGLLQPAVLAAAGGFVVLLGALYVLASRRDVLLDRGDDAPAGAADPAGTDGDEPPAGADAASASAAGDAADDVDVELLSDEERVERLLEQNGGRMKQASIVKETGWSNAKVSQLLSSMEETDRIDKLRIGRENLISFPDEDVADVEE